MYVCIPRMGNLNDGGGHNFSSALLEGVVVGHIGRETSLHTHTFLDRYIYIYIYDKNVLLKMGKIQYVQNMCS